MMRALCLIASALPSLARSEGAVQAFDCVVSVICDEAGDCAPPVEAVDGAVTFRIEPEAVGPEGDGDYRISYRDVSAPMTNVTGLGPLIWSEGDADRQVILFTGEGSLLWQRLDTNSADSSISFLSCEVTQ